MNTSVLISKKERKIKELTYVVRLKNRRTYTLTETYVDGAFSHYKVTNEGGFVQTHADLHDELYAVIEGENSMMDEVKKTQLAIQ
jgi:mannose-6-phosphate isomerase-like protein (cupin superfamily)